MTTLSQIRRAALALPDSVETPGARRGEASFAVAGEAYAVVAGGRIEFALVDDVEAALDDLPDAVRTDHGVRADLALLNGMAANHWVRHAYLAAAPEALATRVRAVASARAGEVGDLPKAIGNPATRALVGAEITSMAQVRERSDAELLALHGLGATALAVLRGRPG